MKQTDEKEQLLFALKKYLKIKEKNKKIPNKINKKT